MKLLTWLLADTIFYEMITNPNFHSLINFFKAS